MCPGNPFPVNVDLKASYKKSIITVDSNILPPEVSKVAPVGAIHRHTYLIKCDGNGNMDFHHLEDPTKTITKLGKLRDEGRITDEEFKQTKQTLLARI